MLPSVAQGKTCIGRAREVSDLLPLWTFTTWIVPATLLNRKARQDYWSKVLESGHTVSTVKILNIARFDRMEFDRLAEAVSTWCNRSRKLRKWKKDKSLKDWIKHMVYGSAFFLWHHTLFFSSKSLQFPRRDCPRTSFHSILRMESNVFIIWIQEKGYLSIPGIAKF